MIVTAGVCHGTTGVTSKSEVGGAGAGHDSTVVQVHDCADLKYQGFPRKHHVWVEIWE
jgi:hypothetical protein